MTKNLYYSSIVTFFFHNVLLTQGKPKKGHAEHSIVLLLSIFHRHQQDVSENSTQLLYYLWSYHIYCASIYKLVVYLGVETRAAAALGKTIRWSVMDLSNKLIERE